MSASTSPILAGVSGVCLGWGFCRSPPILAGVFRCACWSACPTCTPPLLAGLCSVFVGVEVSASPRQFLLGSGVCVFRFGFCFHPVNRGWGVGMSVSASTLPFLAGLYGVCILVRILVSARQSWLGLVVCVFGFGFFFHPANPGWGVAVCVFVCALSLYPAIPCWGLRCVCSRLGYCFTPPILAGVMVCVFGFGFAFRPANPGWACGVCVCVCARSASTPPILAEVYDVCV